MSGAGYGAIAMGALGATRFGIYSKANQMDRIAAHNRLQGANKVGKTGIWSGLKNKVKNSWNNRSRSVDEAFMDAGSRDIDVGAGRIV